MADFSETRNSRPRARLSEFSAAGTGQFESNDLPHVHRNPIPSPS
jgi:hypothetical protein